MEFRGGKVSHETQYFADSFDAAGLARSMGRPQAVIRPAIAAPRDRNGGDRSALS
jgi:hypothetical protein